MKKCPKCGNQVQEDAIFCDQCGTRLEGAPAAPAEAAAEVAEPSAPAPAAEAAQEVAPAPPSQKPVAAAPQGAICPSCGATNTPGEMFCDDCGAPLAAPQPEPEAVAEAQAPPVAAPQELGGPKTCPACGATVADDDEFCYACGADLTQVAKVAAPAPAAPAEPAAEKAAPAPTAEPAETAPSPAAPTVAEAALAPAEETGRVCPACGAKVSPGDTFCEHCGAALVTAIEAAPAAIVTEAVVAGPRLVVVASGVEIPLPAGKETLVGREDPYSGVYPEVDLTPHGGEDAGVSRRHFKLTPSGGGYTIEDLNSTNFTTVNRQRLQPGKPVALNDGDEIRAGNLRLVFKVS